MPSNTRRPENQSKKTGRAQSAIEYLSTYSWAFLLIIVAVAALYAFGVFNTGAFAPATCTVPSYLSCRTLALSTNGYIKLNIGQYTQYPINITAVGCNYDGSTNHMVAIKTLYGVNAIFIPISGNHNFTVPCYTKTGQLSGSLGTLFEGHIVINYTDIPTGFVHTQTGALIDRIKSGTVKQSSTTTIPNPPYYFSEGSYMPNPTPAATGSVGLIINAFRQLLGFT